MRKIFKKTLAGITSIALVATLLVGINVTKGVKAEDTAVNLNKWSFAQGGQYNVKEPGNEGYINSITMNGTNEIVSGWLTGEGSMNQTKSATTDATGFSITIDNTGWDCQWKEVTGFATNRINPWSIQAMMKDIEIQPGHTYTVSFKASATKKKYAYTAFGSETEGVAPYGEDVVTGDNQIMVLGVTEKTFTYTFTNWASVKKLNTTLMLGAFDAQYDFAGNNVSNIVTEVENQWKGTVYINDFTITDNGQHKDFIPEPPKPTTPQQTEAPTVAPTTQAPTTVAPTTKAPTVKKLGKVKNVNAKNNKKGTVKITWKKVKNAKKYQVKVGNKTYTSKKANLTVKKLKKGKKYTVRVRAMKRTGYKAGAWSAKVKVTIKK